MPIVPSHARARTRWRTHSRARSAAPHLAALPEHGRLRQVVLLGLSRTLRLRRAPGCSSPCVGTVPPAAQTQDAWLTHWWPATCTSGQVPCCKLKAADVLSRL
jgi:hypothetical protein